MTAYHGHNDNVSGLGFRLDEEKLRWKELKTRHIIQNKWIDFRESEFEFPDGTSFSPYYSYTRKDYVVVIASDTEGRYICVRQFRQGIMKVTTEFPAGGLEHSGAEEYAAKENADSLEEPMRAAKRELMEETGYAAGRITRLLSIPSNATISSNYAHIFLAENCMKAGLQDLDSNEYLEVELHTEAEIDRLIETGNFEQSMHALAWFMVKCRKNS
jgi:ADP-ribose pyrophosphatase